MNIEMTISITLPDGTVIKLTETQAKELHRQIGKMFSLNNPISEIGRYFERPNNPAPPYNPFKDKIWCSVERPRTATEIAP